MSICCASNLNQAIHAVVPLELQGGEEAPGVKAGGLLEQITRELNVEALPTVIPESIVHDVSALEIGETVLLAAVTVPAGVTLLDDLQDTVLAVLLAPRLQSEDSEIEAETALVGDGDGAGESEESAEDGAEDSSGGH